MSLPPDLLQRSPEEASRLVVLSMLEAASHAAGRLEDPEDAESLHAFRVALRRTRSALRAFRPELKKSAGKRDRRALGALQRATGEGRDAQVALVWLSDERPSLRPPHRLGADWLSERLERRQAESLAHARSGVRDAFEEIRADLVPRLEVVTLKKHLRGRRQVAFGEVLAERVRASAHDLVGLLARIGSMEDVAGCHAARVAGKRLRYLVEPVREHAEAARAVVKRCKRLQDLLGDLNDAHVQRDELGGAIEVAAAERARRLHGLARDVSDDEALRREARRSERAGLLELTRRAQARMEGLYRRLEEEWFQGGMAALLEDVEELCLQLEAAARPDIEIERKYLLRGPVDFSPVAAYVETLEIQQGWLPGERLRERLRRTTGPSGVHYARAVKLGAGVERIEIDEPTTAGVFEALWPLTEGCRIQKRRHRVRIPAEPGGPERVWEIDEFLDRDLWLAEIELDDADESPELPEWLAPQVEREVTDDPRYTNLKLAR